LFLTNSFKVLVAKPGEDWEDMLKNTAASNLHLVKPMSIDISLHKSLLMNDPRIPQFKVAGQLPSLYLHLSGNVECGYLNIFHNLL
jgi:Repeating coiled region of VPS13